MLKIPQSRVLASSYLVLVIIIVSCNASSINVTEINDVEFFKTDEDAQKRVLDLARLEKEEIEKDLLKDKGAQNQVIFDSSNEKPNETLVKPAVAAEENVLLRTGNDNSEESLNKMANLKEQNNRPDPAGENKPSTSKANRMLPEFIDQRLNEISEDQENNRDAEELGNITKYSLPGNIARPSPREEEKDEPELEEITGGRNINSEIFTEPFQSQNTSNEAQKVEQLSDDDDIIQDRNSDVVSTPSETQENVYDPTTKFLQYENASEAQNPSTNELLTNINEIEADDKIGESNGTVDTNSLLQQNVNLSNPELERETDGSNSLQTEANLIYKQGMESPEILNNEEIEEEINQQNSSIANEDQNERVPELVLNSNFEQKENNSISPRIYSINANNENFSNSVENIRNNVEDFKSEEQDTDPEINSSNDERLTQRINDVNNETNGSGSSGLNEEDIKNSLRKILGLFNKNTLVLNTEDNDNGSFQNSVPQSVNAQNNVLTADIEEGESGVPIEVPSIIQANINILNQKSENKKASQNTEQDLNIRDVPVNAEEYEESSVGELPTKQYGEGNITENDNNAQSEQTPETQLERYPDFNDKENSSNYIGKGSEKNNGVPYKSESSILQDILFGTKSIQQNKYEEDPQLEKTSATNEEDNNKSKPTAADENSEVTETGNNNVKMETDIVGNSGINYENNRNLLKNSSELNNESEGMNSNTEEENSRNRNEQEEGVISEAEESNKKESPLSNNNEATFQDNMAKQLSFARALLFNNILKASEENLEQLKKQSDKSFQKTLYADSADEKNENEKLSKEINIPSFKKELFETSDDEDILTQNVDQTLENGMIIPKLNSTGQVSENNCKNDEKKQLENKLIFDQISEDSTKENIPATIPCIKGGETDMKKDEPISLFSHFPPIVYEDRVESQPSDKINENDDVATLSFNNNENQESNNDKMDYLIEKGEYLRDNASSSAGSKDFNENYTPSTEIEEEINTSDDAQKNLSLDVQKDDNKTDSGLIHPIRGPYSKSIVDLDSEKYGETDNQNKGKENANGQLSTLFGSKEILGNNYSASNETENNSHKSDEDRAHNPLNKEHIRENRTRDIEIGGHTISKRTSTKPQDFLEEDDIDDLKNNEFDGENRSTGDETVIYNLHTEPKKSNIFFSEKGTTNGTFSGEYNEKNINEEETEEYSLKKEDNTKGNVKDEDEQIGTDAVNLKETETKSQTNKKEISKENLDDKNTDTIENSKEENHN